jgi:RimJ/RimL family protein N-acetyltransferase
MEVRTHITEEMQAKWFKSVDNDGNYYFVIESDEKRIGLTNIKEIDYETRCGEWGIFLCDERYLNSIMPVKAAIILLDFGFYDLKLETMYAHILRTNKRAVTFNREFGFSLKESQENVDNQLYELTKGVYELNRRKFLRIIR